MGNHRFRLSDMIPNAWFYKLKDMGRPRNQTTRKKHQPKSPQNPPKSNQPHLSHQRKSYYFSREVTDLPPSTTFETTLLNYNSPKIPKYPDTHFPYPPRKSTKTKRNFKKPNRPSENPSAKFVTSSVSAGCSCRASLESVWTKPDSGSDDPSHSPLDSSSDFESLIPELGSDHGLGSYSIDGLVSSSSSCHCPIMETKSFNGKFPEIELPPIITKKPTNFTQAITDLKKKETMKFRNSNGSSKEFQKTTTTSPVRRISVSSPGVRLRGIRTNSPRIARLKIQSSRRRSLSESFAVVKASSDPQKDFRESMVEMIIENNLKASKDLEDLLACYLSLNSYEYHDLIIRVFKKIWFDLSIPC